MRTSSSAALDGMVATPPPANRSLTSGMLRIFTTSALSLSRIGCGVALGASSVVQFEALMSPPPSSCMVGHSGLSGERLVEVTAGTRILQLGTGGAPGVLAR